MGVSLERFNNPQIGEFKVGYRYGISVKSPNNVTISAVDGNGNVLGNNQIVYVTASGDGTTYTATVPALRTSYYDGFMVCVKFDTAATGAIKLNINGWGAKSVYYQSGTSMSDAKANIPYLLVYESSHDAFYVLK